MLRPIHLLPYRYRCPPNKISDFEMVSTTFSSGECDSRVDAHPARYPLQGSEDECMGMQSHPFTAEDIGCTDDFFLNSSMEMGGPLPSPSDQPCTAQFNNIDELQLSDFNVAIQSSNRLKAIETDLEKILVSHISDAFPLPFSSTSNCRSSYNRLNEAILNEFINGGGRELSTEETMRVAAARFIQRSVGTEGDPSILSFSLPGLASEELKNIDLAGLLFAAAEKMSNQYYDEARYLLGQCCDSSSSNGNPVQRVVHYFSDALQDRIDREIGGLSSKRSREDGTPPQDVNKAMLTANSLQLTFHSKIPFSQVMQFTSIQTIVENVGSANRIHMIDLSIRHGIHWTLLMQELATRSTRPVEYLKISAVGTSEEAVATTGKRLVSFAESLNLCFHFKAVIVADMKDLKEDMFEVTRGEAVGIYSLMNMNAMISMPESLENLMRVLRKLNPCILTVMDVEGNHNSPSFINRFTEALFHYSAIFDCLDGFMDREDNDRMVIEGSFFSQGIRSIIATEGCERTVRHVGIRVWRSFFARFGLEEVEPSMWSGYQASLLVKKFAHGGSCTLDKNGKSLIIGWKGTQLFFISAWKFCRKLGSKKASFPLGVN